jgi:hypothetical protein
MYLKTYFRCAILNKILSCLEQVEEYKMQAQQKVETLVFHLICSIKHKIQPKI